MPNQNPKKIKFMKKSKKSKPSVSTANGLNPQNPIKRGRGRPRKYPIATSETRNRKTPIRLVIHGPAALPEISGWGPANRGKRTKRRRAQWTDSDSATVSNSESGTDRSLELNCGTESNSDLGSGHAQSPDSGLSSESGMTWLSGIVIPGPIPDLDELLRDPSIFSADDFFADVPLIEDCGFM